MADITFEKGIYERIWLDDEHTSCTYRQIGTKHYGMTLLDDSHILFERDGVSKRIYVERDVHHEFVYKLLKTKIRAIDGAAGLMNYFVSCFESVVDGTIWNHTIQAVADHAIDVMREAR